MPIVRYMASPAYPDDNPLLLVKLRIFDLQVVNLATRFHHLLGSHVRLFFDSRQMSHLRNKENKRRERIKRALDRYEIDGFIE